MFAKDQQQCDGNEPSCTLFGIEVIKIFLFKEFTNTQTNVCATMRWQCASVYILLDCGHVKFPFLPKVKQMR